LRAVKGVNMKHWLQLNEGTHGFYVVEVFEDLKKHDYQIDRVKSTYDRYQFPTKEEAIKDFEAWEGDNWEGVPRYW
tara:strand:+ start:3218 stop:3445 length:228 start_codon:yes stop_codon:yes gene_type:complete